MSAAMNALKEKNKHSSSTVGNSLTDAEISEIKKENESKMLEAYTKKMIGGVSVSVTLHKVRADDVSDKIVVHSLNARSSLMLSERNMQELLDDITLNDGVINEPILCWHNKEKYICEAIDGSRRLKSAKILHIDVPVLAYEQKLEEHVIKAHIDSTNTSRDFSEYEKLLIVFDAFKEHVKVENPANQKDYWLLLSEFLGDAGFSKDKSSFYRQKSIFENMRERYFEFGRINKFHTKTLDTISKLVKRLQLSDHNYYTEDKIAEIFKEVFDQLENDYEDGSYGQTDFVRSLNKYLGVAGSRQVTPPSEKEKEKEIKIIDADDIKISIFKTSSEWRLTSNVGLPTSVLNTITELCKTHYDIE